MNFELEQNAIVCYEPVGQVVVSQEETQEAIVPDACPDMLRIADVCAQVLPERWEAGEGQARVSGCVRAVVLYIPEEGGAIRRIELKLPFEVCCEMQGVKEDCALQIRSRLRGADGRILNPRKLLLRADFSVEITAMRKRECTVSSGITSAEEESICLKTDRLEHERLSAVVSRRFPLSEEILLTGTQPPTLLSARTYVTCTESRMIGSKLIFKGKADVDLLLQNGDDSFEHRTDTFPFSQIMEAKGVGEGGEPMVWLEMSGMNWIQLPDDPFRIMVEGEIAAFGQVYDREELTVLTDLYSTTHEMLPEVESLTLYAPGESAAIPQTLRELIETRTPVRSICDNRFESGMPVLSRDGGTLNLTLPGRIVVLYLDEERQLHKTEKQVELSLRHSCPVGTRVICRQEEAAELFVAPCAGGMEVRLNLELGLLCARPVELRVVRHAETGELRGRDAVRPSVILRRPEPGEGLWDMAKACGTTVERILQANELTEGDIQPQRMLLIPSTR